MMKKKQLIIYVAMAALLACPISTEANAYGFYPVDDNDDDDHDEAPILVHGPHRSPQNKPVVKVEYNNNDGTVEIRFCKTLTNVSVVICKNGVGVMNCSLGDAPAGSEYMIPLDNDMDTTGMVLYIVSAGRVVSVINLN